MEQSGRQGSICRSVAHWIAPNETPRVPREGLVHLSFSYIGSSFPPFLYFLRASVTHRTRTTKRERALVLATAEVNKINSKPTRDEVSRKPRVIVTRCSLSADVTDDNFASSTWPSGYPFGISVTNWFPQRCECNKRKRGWKQKEWSDANSTLHGYDRGAEGRGRRRYGGRVVARRIFNSNSQKRCARKTNPLLERSV